MARRNKGSLLHSLLDVAQAIPLWANVLLAAGIYAGLHTYAGDHPPAMTPALPGQLGQAFIAYLPKLFGYYGQFVLPPIFIIGGLLGVLKRKVQAKKFDRISAAADVSKAIRSLSWNEFEQMVGEALRKQGYSVTETKKGPDGGIDLLLHKGRERFLVQCKHWKSYKVSVQTVRELYGVMAAQGVAGGFVVTSGVFTSEAQKFAEGINIELVDGQSLTGWFSGNRKT